MTKHVSGRSLTSLWQEDQKKWFTSPTYSGGASTFTDSYTSKGSYKKCAHSHPPLLIDVKGKDHVYTVYGGACGDPIHTGLDIYVALDHGTAHDTRAYPWHGSRQFIFFPITDMSVPKDAVEFKLMIDWLCDQIVAGKSVHVGCLGGHGRTGIVLAALVKMLAGEDDAITYVRERYCKKAVETTAQAEWLNKHFGITVVDGYKTGALTSRQYAKAASYEYAQTPPKPKADTKIAALVSAYGDNAEEVAPFRIKGNIWGATR